MLHILSLHFATIWKAGAAVPIPEKEKQNWRLSQNHPANKKRGRTGTHIARGISVFRSDMLPRYREVKACIMKLRKIELKVVYLHIHL